MELTAAQAKIVEDKHRFRVLNCGRRFGKTTLAIEEIKACAALRESRIAYIAPTYQQARDIAWEALKKDCKDAAISINESRLEIRIANVKGTESIIFLRGWESVETLRGQKFNLLVLDEVAMFKNFWVNWQEILRPTLTDLRGEVLFISTPKGFNHFYDLYNLQEEDTDFKSFHFTTYDNPFIPVDELEKARLQITPDRFAQEYMADFRKTEGLVYKEFDRTRHVYTDCGENFVETIAGVDFGFTNPCAVIPLGRDHTDTYWIPEEFYQTGKTDVQVAEYVAAKNYNKVYPDPEAPAAIAEMKKKEVNVRDVIKGKDSIKNGIDRVRELLKADKLKIHASCKNLIMELETYSYPDRKPGHNENEEPIDENNHALDALRYAVVMNSKAHNFAAVHYSQSSQPTHMAPLPPNAPKIAQVYIPKL